MIVLLETVHPEALALLERADVVRLMAVPTAIDDDVTREEVRAVLTRGRGRITAQMCGLLPNLQVVGRCGAVWTTSTSSLPRRQASSSSMLRAAPTRSANTACC